MYFLKKISIKSKNSDRSVWTHQNHLPRRSGTDYTNLLSNPCKKQQFSPLFLILSTLLFTPAEIHSHRQCLLHSRYLFHYLTTPFSYSPDQLKYVISGAAKVRKSNKAEDFILTKLPKSLGGRGEHWRAPSHSWDSRLWFYVTLMMEKGAGSCQTSPCESSALALPQSTALWQEQRIAFNCRRVVTNGSSWLYRPFIHLIFLQLGCKFKLVVADIAKNK